MSRADHPDRRLIGGLLVSLLLHGLVLLLQFGVPGLGVPGAPPPPLTVRLAPVPTPPAPAPAPIPAPETNAARALPLPPPPPVSGMQVVDAVPTPPPPPQAVVVVKKDQPRRAKRIRSLLPPRETLVEPPRVIAQDSTKNDFVVPLARPDEAEQKTIDPKQAQHGDDDGDADANAALEAAAAKAGALKAEEQAKATRLVQETREAEQKKADEERRVAAEQLKNEQQQLEQKKAEQVLAERQRTEQLKLEQQKMEQARLDQQKLEQARLKQQKAEQAKLEQQKAEQAKLEQQKAEQAKLEQQKAEQAKLEQQKAEQAKLEQQKADQQRAAEQQRAADQQRAAERAAAEQRGKQLAPAQPGPGAQGAAPSGAGAGASGTGQIPKNMLGSDLGNRARELVKGLDVLRGAPPPTRRPGERRIAVGFNERDLSLKMYVESWRQKIERNGALNYPRSWADSVQIDPLVSVAVRSDGTVEDVVILNSSGRADVDEAVRRIVRVNARYSAFPPQIAERYDVIDIRRVWHFDDKLKLMEELH
ncbi:MAG: TonB family protein [Pseudomonadota bacterium]